MGAVYLFALAIVSVLARTTQGVRFPTTLTGWASNAIVDLSHQLTELGGNTAVDNEPAARRALASAVDWPTPTGTVQVTDTITVAAGEVFDGGMKMYVGDSSQMNGGQGEGQKELFKLMDGATLKNVIIGVPGGDGVHCRGSCQVINCWWDDVGEDAATLQGTDPNQVMLIDGGGARYASDKVFQHNGPGTFHIRNFYCQEFGKLYRSCGNCPTTYTRHAIIENVVVVPPFMTLAGVNVNNGDTVEISGVTVLTAPGSAPPKINPCLKYDSTHGGEPTEIGPGINDGNCKYTTADISYSSSAQSLNPGGPTPDKPANPPSGGVPEGVSEPPPAESPAGLPIKLTRPKKIRPRPSPKKPTLTPPPKELPVPSPPKKLRVPPPKRKSVPVPPLPKKAHPSPPTNAPASPSPAPKKKSPSPAPKKKSPSPAPKKPVPSLPKDHAGGPLPKAEQKRRRRAAREHVRRQRWERKKSRGKSVH